MILSVLWPHNEAKSGTFGRLPCPTMGLLSRYLPERSDGIELYRSQAIDLKLLMLGGPSKTQKKPSGFRQSLTIAVWWDCECRLMACLGVYAS